MRQISFALVFSALVLVSPNIANADDDDGLAKLRKLQTKIVEKQLVVQVKALDAEIALQEEYAKYPDKLRVDKKEAVKVAIQAQQVVGDQQLRLYALQIQAMQVQGNLGLQSQGQAIAAQQQANSLAYQQWYAANQFQLQGQGQANQAWGQQQQAYQNWYALQQQAALDWYWLQHRHHHR